MRMKFSVSSFANETEEKEEPGDACEVLPRGLPRMIVILVLDGHKECMVFQSSTGMMMLQRNRANGCRVSWKRLDMMI
jgi:hypothetical protein